MRFSAYKLTVTHEYIVLTAQKIVCEGASMAWAGMHTLMQVKVMLSTLVSAFTNHALPDFFG